MLPKEKKLVWDIVHYCNVIREVTGGLTEDEYLEREELRLSVERALEIIGEALRQLHAIGSVIPVRLPEYRGFIGLRNVIAHGYSHLDHRLVWQFTQDAVPRLGAAANEIHEELT